MTTIDDAMQTIEAHFCGLHGLHIVREQLELVAKAARREALPAATPSGPIRVACVVRLRRTGQLAWVHGRFGKPATFRAISSNGKFLGAFSEDELELLWAPGEDH